MKSCNSILAGAARAGVLTILALGLLVAHAWGQTSVPAPHIGYIYPAGGQQGSTFQILVGGQNLRNVGEVAISGEGIHATLKYYNRPMRLNEPEQRLELQRRIKARRAVLTGGVKAKAVTPSTAQAPEKTTLPNMPMLNSLESLTLRELELVELEFFKPNNKRTNTQIAELALIDVSIEPGAAPGDRELRLVGTGGMTNPMCFQVGVLPEVSEREPNDPRPATTVKKDPPATLPALMNGQIMPGDVDQFRFQARKGQQLVIVAQARHLIPYLADAVPGWFQATLALYDAQGKEMAFADDYRFNPDPVLFFTPPADGIYTLEIRDSIYRGREDFIYRIAVSEQPFITQRSLLGGPAGKPIVTSIEGYNLPRKMMKLDTRPEGDPVRLTGVNGPMPSNRVPYAVDTLPECDESELNDARPVAQAVALPMIVNGRIAKPGDVDIFRFEGQAGDSVVAEVQARRLHSPLDSLLRLTDAEGKVLAWNDDHEEQETGLQTHHADSYLTARLPAAGTYYVELSDAAHHGSAASAYRLRIGPPRPDFALRVIPSSLSIPAGRTVALIVHALRKDGYEGAIDLALQDAPAGFLLQGGRIPAGQDRVNVTLTAPVKPIATPVDLHITGRARIDGQAVSRPAVPAEDLEQAFLYRHLTPSQELLVAVTGSKGRTPPITLAGKGPLRITPGGTTQVRMIAPAWPNLKNVKLALSNPPKGMTLEDMSFGPAGLAFNLKAEAGELQPGAAANLIVEAFMEVVKPPQDGKPATPPQRYSLGVLPAIPYEVVQP